jgi:hypothetical protein
MFFRTPRTTASVPRGDEGSALITVVLVSMVVGALAALALASGRQSESSSASDRNHEQSLGGAEAGLNQVVARISGQAVTSPGQGVPNYWVMAPGATLPSSCTAGGQCAAALADTTATTGYNAGSFSGTTPQGKYWYWVTRCGRSLTPALPCPGAALAQGFIVDIQAATGVNILKRGRHVQVTLTPPARFPNNASYALFSNTSIVVQNNDQVLDGDVWANDNVLVSNSNADPTLRGSLTSLKGWIELDQGVHVTGNAWSGGYNTSGSSPWAVNLGGGAIVDGWVKASVYNPTDPTTCGNETRSNYNVVMSSGSSIGSGLTTLGTPTGAGTVHDPHNYGVCSSSSPPQPFPTFNQNDLSLSHPPFDSVAAFQGWMYCEGGLGNLQGTFIVNESEPGQTGNGTNCNNNDEASYHRIDLTGATLTGPLTIVSNAPIYTGSLDDSQVPCPQLPCNSVLTLVSHYQPATSTSCSTVDDNSECAVHIKNSFTLNANGTCKTATLVYADLGPVAIKNGGNFCGSVESDGILVKNGQTVTYDARVDRILGFGDSAYAVTRWQELAAK